MRQLFPGYYKPTDQEFERLWDNCIFAFDANILLNLYRYSSDTQTRLFEVFERLNDRIWLPHQVALEFHERRLGVIAEQFDIYNKANEFLDKFQKDLSNSVLPRHLFIDVKRIQGIFGNAIKKTKRMLAEAKSSHPDYFFQDDLLEKITTLFHGKIGKPYSNVDLATRSKEAQERIKGEIPPGYKDRGKQDISHQN